MTGFGIKTRLTLQDFNLFSRFRTKVQKHSTSFRLTGPSSPIVVVSTTEEGTPLLPKGKGTGLDVTTSDNGTSGRLCKGVPFEATTQRTSSNLFGLHSRSSSFRDLTVLGKRVSTSLFTSLCPLPLVVFPTVPTTLPQPLRSMIRDLTHSSSSLEPHTSQVRDVRLVTRFTTPRSSVPSVPRPDPLSGTVEVYWFTSPSLSS